MNYHLMVDEKFIDSFINMAEKAAPGKNTYLFTFKKPARFVKSTLGTHISAEGDELGNYLATLKPNDKVFVHWFYDGLMPHIKRLPDDVLLYLLFWGGDFFEQSEEMFQYNYEPLTLKLYNWLIKYSMFHLAINPLNYYHQLRLHLTVKERWKTERREQTEIRKEFLHRLNGFGHWNERDLERIKSYYGGNPTFVPFFYDSGFSKLEDRLYQGSNGKVKQFWFGNSANFTNNHLDAFEDLKKFIGHEFELTAPLSYGHKRYGKIILRAGKKIFGNKFKPLTTFLPIAEYLTITHNIDVVIMSHNRTQAGANIFAFLRMGKKVFLKRKSTVTRLCEANGIKIFYTDDIPSLTFEEFVQPLTIEEMENNRRIVNALFSEERRLELMKNMLA